MALQASGTISFQDLEDEFNSGSGTPISLDDYHRGESLVPDTVTNSGVPTTGTISLDDFYGAADLSAPSSVTVSNISVIAPSDFDDTHFFNENTSASVVPPDSGGDYTYTWTKISGDTISNTGSGSTRTFSASITPGDNNTGSKSATYRCTVSNALGSAFDNFTVYFEYTDLGS